MASNRHLGRIIILQTLYEYDIRKGLNDDTADIMEIMERNLERYRELIDDQKFVKDLAYGISKVYHKLDELLQPIAPEWPINQIATIDRNVLRIGLFELLFMSKTVPPKAAINEAIELAKSFGSNNSKGFVNGVLGTAYRDLVKDDQQNETTTKKESKDEKTSTTETKSESKKDPKTITTTETS